MPKLFPRAGRIVFLAACCFIGMLWIWPSIFSIHRGAAAASPQTAAEIPLNETVRAVWNSGLYKESVGSTKIYWLDNDTIVVSANNGPKPVTSQQRQAAEIWLYLWRLGQKPQPYGADPHGAALGYCAARGEISYIIDAVDPRTGAKSRTRWLGPPGHEHQVPPWTTSAVGEARNPPSIDRADCEIYADPAMAGKVYVTDSERRFYLDFGDEPLLAAVNVKPTQSIVMMRADGSGRTPLPITNATASPGSTHFHTFDGVFYLWNGSLAASPVNDFAIWRDTKCWPIWRIDPQTAKSERVCIPFGPWSGINSAASLALAPTKAGLFFSSRSINAKDESGFYRLENGTVSRILRGHIVHPVVSPSGCRVAFIHMPTIDSYGAYSPVSSSIVAIDVCSPDPGAPRSSN